MGNQSEEELLPGHGTLSRGGASSCEIGVMSWGNRGLVVKSLNPLKFHMVAETIMGHSIIRILCGFLILKGVLVSDLSDIRYRRISYFGYW
jgi:hypothetical protein